MNNCYGSIFKELAMLSILGMVGQCSPLSTSVIYLGLNLLNSARFF